MMSRADSICTQQPPITALNWDQLSSFLVDDGYGGGMAVPNSDIRRFRLAPCMCACVLAIEIDDTSISHNPRVNRNDKRNQSTALVRFAL